jgi:membrane protease subunit HflC
MMRNNSLTIVILLLVVAVVGSQCFFTVHQTQTALVLQLGEPLNKVYEPGLHFKMPFIQNVVYFDSRVLDYEARSREAFTVDKKAIVLDNYARWKIINPLQFYRTMRTIPGAQARLDDVVYSQLRALVGAYTLTEVVSSHRAAIMKEVTNKVSALMHSYGVEVLDVRIKRTDLPPENQRAIFGRMRAERERQAKQYRSEGEEESTRIRSDADRQRAVILAEAAREAQITRGTGDAKAASVYAQSYNKAPQFYAYQRWLEAMRKSLKENSKMVLANEAPLLNPQH